MRSFVILPRLALLLACGVLSNSATVASQHVMSGPSPTTSGAVIKGSGGPRLWVRWSPDGKWLVGVSQFGPVLIYDVNDLSSARIFPVGMWMVDWSPDGKMIVTAEGRDGARTWDSSSGGRPLTAKESSTGPYDGIQHLRVFDKPLRVLESPDPDAKNRVFWTEFSPDGKRLLESKGTGNVKVWNTSTWELEQTIAITSAECRTAAFTNDGQAVLVGDTDGALRLWSLTEKRVIRTLNNPIPEPNSVSRIVFSRSSRVMLSTHLTKGGSSIVRWNTADWTGTVIAGDAAAISSNGEWIAVGGDGVRLTSTLAGAPGKTLPLLHPDVLPKDAVRTGARADERQSTQNSVRVVSLAFSPDDSRIAAGCSDGTIQIIRVPH